MSAARQAICLLVMGSLLLAGCVSGGLPRVRFVLPGAPASATPPPSGAPAFSKASPTPTQTPLPRLYPELPRLRFASPAVLSAVPGAAEARLPVPAVALAEEVQLVGTDPNGAWLLVLRHNSLGWTPALYFGAGAATLAAESFSPLLPDACAGYLGSAFTADQEWRSDRAAAVLVIGTLYIPVGQPAPNGAALILNSSRKMALQLQSSRTAGGGQLAQFSQGLEQVQAGDELRLSAELAGLPLLVSFFTLGCGAGTVSAASPDSAKPPQAHTSPELLRTTLEITTAGRGAQGGSSVPGGGVDGKAWLACEGYHLSRLQVGVIAEVSRAQSQRNNVRKMPYTSAERLGAIAPGERVEVIKGPSCSGGHVWWKVRSQSSGLTGWTAEGDAYNYWLDPLR